MYKKDKIRVNCICPGSVRTNLLEKEGWDAMPQEYFTSVENVAMTVKKLVDGEESEKWGKAWEIAGSDVFERGQREYASRMVEELMERLARQAVETF